MQLKLKILLITLFTYFVFISCSDNEDNPNNPDNHPPRIIVLSSDQSTLKIDETASLTCYAADGDNDILTYSWNAAEGSFPLGTNGSLVDWKAPGQIGNFQIEVSVSDKIVTVEDTLMISVIDDPCEGISTIVYEGATYNTIPIGKQCWIKENINVGNMIDDSLDMTNQDSIEKYCYDNIESNCDDYGGLYQWKEAMQYSIENGAQGICPSGWHLPTFSELQTLKLAVNNSSNSLKSIGQGYEEGAGSNTSGFSALLAGMRFDDTNFGNFSDYGIFWSSSFDLTSYDAAYYMYLNSEDDDILLDFGTILTGASVRCIKD